MRLDIDTYREILDTLTRNKTRSLLTGFGVFWGVFMLVVLIGGGDGLKTLLQKNFAGFATNSAMVWANQTTKPYKGMKKGRWWQMTDKDMERLRHQIPELDVIAPITTSGWNSSPQATFDNNKTSCSMVGVTTDYAKVQEPTIFYGRYLNEVDIRQERKVCVIGKRVYNNLFPKGGNPCGMSIAIDSIYYKVVGVDYNTNGINVFGSPDETVSVPISVLRKAYNKGTEVHTAAMTVKPGYTVSGVTPRIREVIARAHTIDPTDERGVMVFNTEVLFGILDNLFKGVNFLIWLVGLGTILAGAIGVSNIIMVTVRERTTEIGIRRAIGATPRMILSQIIAESLVLTSVAGMSGILFGVMILQMLELANTTDGILAAQFQIGFWTAILCAALLSVLGVLAGLAPAYRAMSIKPVDAMRDE